MSYEGTVDASRGNRGVGSFRVTRGEDRGGETETFSP